MEHLQDERTEFLPIFSFYFIIFARKILCKIIYLWIRETFSKASEKIIDAPRILKKSICFKPVNTFEPIWRDLPSRVNSLKLFEFLKRKLACLGYWFIYWIKPTSVINFDIWISLTLTVEEINLRMINFQESHKRLLKCLKCIQIIHPNIPYFIKLKLLFKSWIRKPCLFEIIAKLFRYTSVIFELFFSCNNLQWIHFRKK